jgi:anti-sigma28 factor (negative regulator of flagellin synthesis)
MRIDDTTGITNAQGMDKLAGSRAEATSRIQVAETTDRAHLTPVAEQIQSADPQRLEALRVAVESGQYRVSANDLAESIMSNHLKP